MSFGIPPLPSTARATPRPEETTTPNNVTCPVCGSVEVVIDLSDEIPAARCETCEATWEQRGSRQRAVRPGKLRGVPDRRKRGLAVFPFEG